MHGRQTMAPKKLPLPSSAQTWQIFFTLFLSAALPDADVIARESGSAHDSGDDVIGRVGEEPADDGDVINAPGDVSADLSAVGDVMVWAAMPLMTSGRHLPESSLRELFSSIVSIISLLPIIALGSLEIKQKSGHEFIKY